MTMQLAERKKLIGFIAEIEASRDRAKGETRHQSEVFKKAKEDGFDNKAMRKVLQRRAMSQVDREKMDEAVDDYEHALGALALAKEAVSAGMSAREAAEKYQVPRGALGVLTGARNAISEPPDDTTDKPDGPGSVLATDSEAAPSAQETVCLAKPQMEAREENASVTPVPDEGVGDWPVLPPRLDRRLARAT